MPGHRTIYAAYPEACSYAEALASLRPAADLQTKLSDLFSDEAEDWTIEDAVLREWGDRSHMRSGSIPKGWRIERNIYPITIPETGWFVDIEASESISTLMKSHPELLARHGVDQLTTEHLHGASRLLTTSIAECVHRLKLFDGSLPHGIYFTSKHDREWECWSIWLRAVDDGKHLSSEPTRAGPGDHIEPATQNQPLRKVCDLFGLICH